MYHYYSNLMRGLADLKICQKNSDFIHKGGEVRIFGFDNKKGKKEKKSFASTRGKA